MRRVLLSAVAAAALLSVPALAQSTNQTSSTQMPGIATSGNGSAGGAGSMATTGSPAADQLASELKNAGMTQETQVQGTVYSAQTSDGLPVFVVVAPASLKTQAPPNFDRNGFTKKLDQADLKNAQQVSGANLVHGMMNNQGAGDQKAILAMSGLNLQNNGGGGNTSFNQNQFEKTLNSAGIKADTPFQAKLVRAEGPEGPILIVVGDDDLIAQSNDKPVNINANALRQLFQKGDLKNFSLLDNVHLFQGTTGDDTVFVIAGKGMS